MKQNITKRTLLAIAAMLTVGVAGAQTSFETALTAKTGSNSYTVEGETSQDIYWKYTSSEATLLYLDPLSGYNNAIAYEAVESDGTTSYNLLKATAVYDYSTYVLSNVYPIEAGQTLYLKETGTGTLGFKLTTKKVEGLGHGLTKDDPVTIIPGEEHYLGNARLGADGYIDRYNTYATYTATADGKLAFSTVTSATAYLTMEDGSSLDGNKLMVEAGKTYNFIYSLNTPVIFTTEFSQPTAGSLDVPFALNEGENVVPKEAGTYYYTYTPSTLGYLVTSSEATMSGQMTYYPDLNSLSYNYSSTIAPTGSFNLRVEIPYQLTSPCYIVIKRTADAEADQTFTATMEAYKQGDKEANPFVIESLPSTQTLPTATGTYYYSVTLPATTDQFLSVQATGDVASGTRVYVYKSGESKTYGSAQGNSGARLALNTTEPTTYLISWTASGETTPITFNVQLDGIEPGDTYGNPIQAVVGDNNVTASTAKYYQYTATKTGKLTVAATDKMTVSFPKGESVYAGEYETTQTGHTYKIDITAGTTYIIKVVGAEPGTAFTLSEDAYAAGEDRTTALDLTETGAYTFDSTPVTSIWFMLTAKAQDVVEASTDIAYNGAYTVEFGKSSDYYLKQIVKTSYESGEAVTRYEGMTVVSEGDVCYLHLSLGGSVLTGKKVTLTERDFQEGEDASKPILLTDGSSVTIGDASYDTPRWFKFTLKDAEEYTLKASGYVGGTIYNSYEDTSNEYGGTSAYFVTDYTDGSSYYTAKATDGDYWLAITSNYDNATLALSVKADANAIHNVEAPIQNDAAYYTLQGIRVEHPQKGIFIHNGRKVIIK